MEKKKDATESSTKKGTRPFSVEEREGGKAALQLLWSKEKKRMEYSVVEEGGGEDNVSL